MILGQVIALVFLAIGLAFVAWGIWGRPSRRALKRRARKGIRRAEGNVLPRSNGQGSKYGNRRVFRGKTRKPRPAPPEPNGGKRRPG